MTDAPHFFFHRPGLAAMHCDALCGLSLADKRSGLFLAGMRRVGKSTYLRQDLIPAAQSRGWHTLIIDLWSDRNADPGELLINEIKRSLQTTLNIVGKAAGKLGLSRFSVAGFTFDMAASGLPTGVTITSALQALHAQVRRPVLFVVDEAQHALSSDAGINAMFALKAARDAINRADGAPDLMLVFTGSNRDKLAHLCSNREMPFMGSKITAFPLLNREYTDAYTLHLNRGLAQDNQFRADDVFETFKLVNHRPEFLREIISEIALEALAAPELGQRLLADAALLRARAWSEIDQAYTALTPLQQSIICTMAQVASDSFSPFSTASVAAYGPAAQGVTTGAIQSAIDGLREMGIVWKEARGAYELEDSAWRHWLADNGHIPRH